MASTKTLLVLAAAALVPLTTAADEIELREIMQRSAERQAAIRSYSVEWTCSVSNPQETLNRLRRMQAEMQNQPYHEPAGNTSSFEFVSVFIGSGDRYRHSEIGSIPGLHPDGTIAPKPFDHLKTFDGKSLLGLRAAAGSRPFPQGSIERITENSPYGPLQLKPILWWCRPMDSNLMGRYDNPETVVSADAIGGRPCILLSLTTPDQYRWDAWLDPARDYSLVRATRMRGQATMSLIEVSYRHGTDGWMPAAWTATLSPNDESQRQFISSAVTSCTINESYPDSTFTMEFPPGALVLDNPSNNKRDYIVREDGSKRPIMAPERFKSYEELISTEPEGPQQGRSFKAALFVALNVCLILGILAVAFTKSWRKQRAALAAGE